MPTSLDSADDTSFETDHRGMGLPGEKFDLICPECGDRMSLRPSRYGLFYGCVQYPACTATHGADATGAPRGTPGNKETRLARIAAHKVFDRLWEDESGAPVLMTRPEAYTWMRKALNLSKEEGHIARFDVEQCQRLIAEVQKTFFPQPSRTAWAKILDEDLGP